MSTELLSSMQQLQGMGLMAAAGPATTEPLPKSRYRLTKLAISAVVLGLLQATAADAEPIAARHEPIPDQVWEEMQGSSWHPNRGCPARESLALLTVPYRDFAGETRLGRLVFAKRVANQVASIFTEIFESQKFRNRTNGARRQVQGGRRRFNGGQQYERIQLPFRGGYDGFVRPRAGDRDRHQSRANPFVKGAVTEPPKGKAFDRPSKRQSAHSRGQPGIIMPGDVVVTAFKRQGWKWGGDWSSKKDYQHFSENGR